MGCSENTCALTFDDGPDPRWTPRILDRLRSEDAPATFFVIAPRAARHHELIHAMLGDGHDVQLHCDRHVRHTRLSESALRTDVERATRRLSGVGIRPTRWRSPWGVCTDATRVVAAERGLSLIGWDVDTHDWRGDAAEEMHERIAGDLRAGSIVLMHDGVGPGARRSGARATFELIPRLLETMRTRGLRAGHLGGIEPAGTC
jgi:peptidoglycan-N-acetylglucosamine deacetylase